MKVLLLTTHLNIGGVAIYTVNLAKGLRAKGFTVYVASSGGELVSTLDKNGIHHLKLNIKTKFEFHPKLIVAFFKSLFFIKNNKIDLVHAQTRVAQVLSYIISKVSGISYVSTCHGFFKSKRFGRKLLSAWGNYVIAISEAVRNHLEIDFHIRRRNLFLVHNGIDVKAFLSETDENEKKILKENIGFKDCRIIGSICRLSPVKGLRYLMFAMKEIVKDMPEARLLLIGEGPSRDSLAKLAHRLNIDGKVFFGHSTQEVNKFLSVMDVFVFYSLEEGLGLSLLEALAAGRACVATDVGGISSIIENGVTGLLVPAHDADALKETVSKVLKDRALADKLAENGMNMVREKFSLERMIERVIDIYGKAHQSK